MIFLYVYSIFIAISSHFIPLKYLYVNTSFSFSFSMRSIRFLISCCFCNLLYFFLSIFFSSSSTFAAYPDKSVRPEAWGIPSVIQDGQYLLSLSSTSSCSNLANWRLIFWNPNRYSFLSSFSVFSFSFTSSTCLLLPPLIKFMPLEAFFYPVLIFHRNDVWIYSNHFHFPVFPFHFACSCIVWSSLY